MANLRIVHTGVNRFTEGQIVPGTAFDAKETARLLRLGAVEETSDAPTHDVDGEIAAEEAAGPRMTTGQPGGAPEGTPATQEDASHRFDAPARPTNGGRK